MVNLSAWLDSWNRLRSEWETRSFAFAHPQVNLCRWVDSKFSVGQPKWRMDEVLCLTDLWVKPVRRGKSPTTRIPRTIVMGIGERTMNGDGVMFWLMHERVARAAQARPLDANKLAAELDRAHEVETIFKTLGDRAGNLLREIPDGAGFHLAQNVAGIGSRLWVDALFSDFHRFRNRTLRVTHWLPSYVPANCQWDWELGRVEVLDNPFAASVCLIESLPKGEAELGLSLLPNEARAKFCFEQWQGGKTLKEINVALKRHELWDHFEDEKAVRSPINAWAKRIGVTPRKGRPGPRPK